MKQETGTIFGQPSAFSLVEVIAALVITGLVAGFAGMLLTTSAGIFVTSRTTDEDSQKIQAAMNRLIKELTWAESIRIPDAHTIMWNSFHPEPTAPSLVATQVGSSLLLNGAPLIDGVASFEVEQTSGAIQLSLTSTRVPGVTHKTRVHPRR